MSIFETLGQKLEILLSIFRGTKINVRWIIPPIFRSTPAPLIRILKTPYLPFVTGGFKLWYEYIQIS